MLFPAIASTKPTIALFRPVDDTAPTIMPAVATATPIVIILRVPDIMPCITSITPDLKRTKTESSASLGRQKCCNRIIAISNKME